MSLINDALKKAQKQRTGETPSLASMPSVGGETPHRIARRDKPTGFDTLVIRAGVGLGALLVVVVGGYFAFRSDSAQQSSAPSPQPVAAVPAAQPAPPAVQQPAPAVPLPAQNAQVSTPTPTPAPTPTFTLPVASKPEPAAPVTVAGVADPGPASSRPATTASTHQVSAPSAAPAQPTGSDPRVSPFRAQTPPPVQAPQIASTAQVSDPAKPALKLEPRAIQYIENIKVAGIMARPTDSKVLMNDRVYRIGSLVEAEMGLTLVGITSNSLTFEDGNGGRYTRTF